MRRPPPSSSTLHIHKQSFAYSLYSSEFACGDKTRGLDLQRTAGRGSWLFRKTPIYLLGGILSGEASNLRLIHPRQCVCVLSVPIALVVRLPFIATNTYYQQLSAHLSVSTCDNQQNEMRSRITLVSVVSRRGTHATAQAAERQSGATDAERTYLCEQAIRRHHNAS
jgi:hypothetical protein